MTFPSDTGFPRAKKVKTVVASPKKPPGKIGATVSAHGHSPGENQTHRAAWRRNVAGDETRLRASAIWSAFILRIAASRMVSDRRERSVIEQCGLKRSGKSAQGVKTEDWFCAPQPSQRLFGNFPTRLQSRLRRSIVGIRLECRLEIRRRRPVSLRRQNASPQ